MGQDSTDLGTKIMVTITSTRVAGSKIVFSVNGALPAGGPLRKKDGSGKFGKVPKPSGHILAWWKRQKRTEGEDISGGASQCSIGVVPRHPALVKGQIARWHVGYVSFWSVLFSIVLFSKDIFSFTLVGWSRFSMFQRKFYYDESNINFPRALWYSEEYFPP